jgi:hypothetical protein
MPEWRHLDPWGKEIQTGKWVEEVLGDWGPLRNPGINGLCSVFACMKWLLAMHVRDASGEGEFDIDSLDGSKASPHWVILLDDIKWVVIALRLAEEGDTDLPPRKRFRCASE